MKRYLDTSAPVPLYVEESSSERILGLCSEAAILSTHLFAYTEFHAALAQRLGLGDLTEQDHAACIERFDADWEDLAVVQITEDLVRWAARMAYLCGLRGRDSIHLAAAAFLQRELTEPVRFACFDHRLNLAAQSLGLNLVQVRRRSDRGMIGTSLGAASHCDRHEPLTMADDTRSDDKSSAVPLFAAPLSR